MARKTVKRTTTFTVFFRFPGRRVEALDGPNTKKSRPNARRYARQLVREGAEYAEIVEDATGNVVRKYTRADAPAPAWKDNAR